MVERKARDEQQRQQEAARNAAARAAQEAGDRKAREEAKEAEKRRQKEANAIRDDLARRQAHKTQLEQVVCCVLRMWVAVPLLRDLVASLTIDNRSMQLWSSILFRRYKGGLKEKSVRKRQQNRRNMKRSKPPLMRIASSARCIAKGVTSSQSWEMMMTSSCFSTAEGSCWMDYNT